MPAHRWTVRPWADVVAGLLIIAQTVWRSILQAHAVLRQDDFVLAAQAHRSGLATMFEDYHGHVQALGWIVAWLADLVAPMRHWPLGVIVSVLQVLASVLGWLAIRSLVGPRPIAVLALTVLLFSPLTVGPSVWAAAAIQMLALQLAIFGAVLAHGRAVRLRTSGSVALAWVTVGLGLAANEKALAVPLLLAALTAVVSVRGLRESLRTDRTLWSGYAVLVAAEVVLYLAIPRSDNLSPASSIGQLAGDGFGGTWLPQIAAVPIGGRIFAPLVEPPGVTAIVIAVIAVVAVFVFAVSRTGGRAVRAFVLVAAYVAADYAVVAVSRLGFGSLIALDPRYIADTVPVVSLCLALALTQRPGDRPWHLGTVRGRPPRRARIRFAVLAAALAYIAAAIPVTARTATAGVRAGDSGYVARLRHHLSGRDLTLVDGPVPSGVVNGLFGSDALLSGVASVLPGRRVYSGPARQPYLVDAAGRLRAAAPGPGSLRLTGPEPGCGWGAESDSPVTIPSPDPLDGGPGLVSIGYVLGAPTPATFSVAGRAATVALPQGLGHVVIVVEHGAGPVSVGGVRSGVRLCISDVTVGKAAPLN